tara:strand:- start:550 stop:855 length:306 start_codon:yes stop_codon:yes gene_type:complete
MKDKIPRSFKVFDSTINIEYADVKLSYESLLGDCSYTDSKIRLCLSYKGEALNHNSILDTFYHEKIHIILDAMGEHELSKNEKFVEVFSRLLRQTDNTSEY